MVILVRTLLLYFEVDVSVSMFDLCETWCVDYGCDILDRLAIFDQLLSVFISEKMVHVYSYLFVGSLAAYLYDVDDQMVLVIMLPVYYNTPICVINE